MSTTITETQVVSVSDTEVNILTVGTQGPAGVGVPTGGTTGQALVKTSNTDYATGWTTIASGGTPAGSTGQIQFNSSGAFGADTALHWDNANKRLGIGTASPAARLHAASLATGDIVSIFQAFTGQTAALSEWRTSAGTVVANIGSTGNATFSNITGNPSVTINNAGNSGATSALVVGTTTVGLHVSGVNYDVRIVASGAARIPFTVRGAASQTGNLTEWQNSAGTILSQVNASGVFTLPQINWGFSGGALMYCFAGSAYTTPGTTGNGLGIFLTPNTNGYGIGLGGNPWNGTSGAYTHIYQAITISPTSGTAQYMAYRISPTINQTGGANGITRGLYITPTLTAAADWRSIETNNNSGYAIYAGGTAPSLFNGGIIPASMTDASAANGTIYYSTTASKLVYKDSGGTVNALY